MNEDDPLEKAVQSQIKREQLKAEIDRIQASKKEIKKDADLPKKPSKDDSKKDDAKKDVVKKSFVWKKKEDAAFKEIDNDFIKTTEDKEFSRKRRENKIQEASDNEMRNERAEKGSYNDKMKEDAKNKKEIDGKEISNKDIKNLKDQETAKKEVKNAGAEKVSVSKREVRKEGAGKDFDHNVVKSDGSASNAEKDEGLKVWQKIVIGVVLLLIIGIVFYFMTHKDNGDEKPAADRFTYVTGFDFVKVNSYWVTRIQSGNLTYDIPLRYNPYEVENITAEGDFKKYAAAYRKYGYSYLTLDDWDEGGGGYLTMSVNEVSKIFAKVFGNKVIAACTTANMTGSCETFNFTTKRCNSTKEPVVYIKLDNETKISGINNCIIIQGNGEDLMRATDKLFYIWFGVMEEESAVTNHSLNSSVSANDSSSNSTLKRLNMSELTDKQKNQLAALLNKNNNETIFKENFSS